MYYLKSIASLILLMNLWIGVDYLQSLLKLTAREQREH